MMEFHLLTRKPVGLPVLPEVESCSHADWLSTDGDAIRCCRCRSHLIMVPNKPGEFRLEWVRAAA